MRWPLLEAQAEALNFNVLASMLKLFLNDTVFNVVPLDPW